MDAEALAFSPDGRFLAAGSNQIKIWDTSSWKEVISIGPAEVKFYHISELAFSPDGKYLAAADFSDYPEAPKVTVIETGSWRVIKKFGGCYLEIMEVDYQAHPLSFSPDGKYLAGGKCIIKTGRWEKIASLPKEIPQDSWELWDLEFSRDGEKLFVSSKGEIYVVHTGR